VISYARHAWGARAAALAGLLMSVQFLFGFHECFLLSETLACFLLAAAARLALGLRDGGTPAGWAAAGAVAGLAGLTRGELAAAGPVIAAVLAKPKALKGPAVYLAAWLLLLGGWAARNAAQFGYFGLTPNASTTLLATALPLVRHDAPAHARAKRLLRESSTPGVSPEAEAARRLESEPGYDYLKARLELGAVGREAAAGSPWRYAVILAREIPNYVLPFDWTLAPWPGADALGAGAWKALRSSLLTGWVIVLSAAAALWKRGAPEPRAFVLPYALFAVLLALVLPTATASRTQAELQLLLVLPASFAASRLLAKKI
jgi:hypothetical protein